MNDVTQEPQEPNESQLILNYVAKVASILARNQTPVRNLAYIVTPEQWDALVHHYKHEAMMLGAADQQKMDVTKVQVILYLGIAIVKPQG